MTPKFIGLSRGQLNSHGTPSSKLWIRSGTFSPSNPSCLAHWDPLIKWTKENRIKSLFSLSGQSVPNFATLICLCKPNCDENILCCTMPLPNPPCEFRCETFNSKDGSTLNCLMLPICYIIGLTREPFRTSYTALDRPREIWTVCIRKPILECAKSFNPSVWKVKYFLQNSRNVNPNNVINCENRMTVEAILCSLSKEPGIYPLWFDLGLLYLVGPLYLVLVVESKPLKYRWNDEKKISVYFPNHMDPLHSPLTPFKTKSVADPASIPTLDHHQTNVGSTSPVCWGQIRHSSQGFSMLHPSTRQ